MSITRFTIHTEPLPKQRPRFGNGRTYTSVKTANYEELVLQYYQIAGQEYLGTQDLVVVIKFYRKNHRRSDLDNLSKAVLDALNHQAFEDDKQIVHLLAKVSYGHKDEARAEVMIANVLHLAEAVKFYLDP
jgi:Holliday junction resolvase RusA-like endonuclease